MSSYRLRKVPDPILRQKALEVPDGETCSVLIAAMRHAMAKYGGVGLAANQIGVLKRVIVWNTKDLVGYAINPVLTDLRGEQRGTEGCLSIPGERGRINRARALTLTGRMMSGPTFSIEVEDHLARVIQHEVDHLNGILWTDHLNGATL